MGLPQTEAAPPRVSSEEQKDRDLFTKLGTMFRLETSRERWAADAGRKALYEAVFRRTVTTPVGRVCGGLALGQVQAAECMALADDVRKSVLFSLVSAGHEL